MYFSLPYRYLCQDEEALPLIFNIELLVIQASPMIQQTSSFVHCHYYHQGLLGVTINEQLASINHKALICQCFRFALFNAV